MNASAVPGSSSVAAAHAAQAAPPSAEDLTLFTSLAAYADALDALPLELTRSFSDLRELDAVLGAHISSLTARLGYLTSLIEDPEVTPGERLVALKEVAEEARAYKMGGEDKIRVAVNTAEIIVSHTDYIGSLLENLNSVPSLSPFLDPVSYLKHAGIIPGPTGDINYPPGLDPLGPAGFARSGHSGQNNSQSAAALSSAAAPGYLGAAAPDYLGNGPPKKSRRPAAGVSSLSAAADKRLAARDSPALGGPAASGSTVSKKRRPPAHSSASIAKSARIDYDDAAAFGQAGGAPAGTASRPSAKASGKQALTRPQPISDMSSRDYEDDLSEQASLARNRNRNPRAANAGADEDFDLSATDPAQGGPRRRLHGPPGYQAMPSDVMTDGPNGPPKGRRTSNAMEIPVGGVIEGVGPIPFGGPEERRYCYCNQFSFGEMIGCDDDDCEREWFHLDCVNLEKTPTGTWYCDACLERRARQKAKRSKGGNSGSRSSRK